VVGHDEGSTATGERKCVNAKERHISDRTGALYHLRSLSTRHCQHVILYS
jgi:hypothetical protein